MGSPGVYQAPPGVWASSPARRLLWAVQQVERRLTQDPQTEPEIAAAQSKLEAALSDPVLNYPWDSWYTRTAKLLPKPTTKDAMTSGDLSAGGLLAPQQGVRRRYRRVAKAGEHTGAAVMLYPSLADAQALAVPGGEPPDELHVTLVFLGDASEIDEPTRQAILDTVRTWSEFDPFTLALEPKLAIFHGDRDGDGKDPLIAKVEPTQTFLRARELLVGMLRRRGAPIDTTFTDYKPHLTLAYVPTGDADPVGAPKLDTLTLGEVVVAFGDDVHPFRLGAVAKMIREQADGWHVYSQDGTKHLGGPYATKDEALARLRQVEHFKGALRKDTNLPPQVLTQIDAAVREIGDDLDKPVTQEAIDARRAAVARVVTALGLRFSQKQLDDALAATMKEVTGIGETTRTMLRNALIDTMERAAEGQTGATQFDFAREIRGLWSGLSQARAETIARTEYNRAASTATQLSNKELGFRYKVWYTVGDAQVCPFCEANAAVGEIPIDDVFPSGDDAPPLHPSCRCNVASATGPGAVIASEAGVIEKYDESEPRDEQGRWTDAGGDMGGGSTSFDAAAYEAAHTKADHPGWYPYTPPEHKVWWHGTPSGDLRGSGYGLHVGSKLAATQALEARIGRPAHGEWDGTREYGKTLLAGRQKTDMTGYNADAPDEDHYPTPGKAKYSDGTPVAMDAKPAVFPVRITGKMSNTPTSPHADFAANGRMSGQLKRGTARSGYYYTNVGEDAGSISAVLPNGAWVERLDRIEKYDDSEPRDEAGRWTDGGGDSGRGVPGVATGRRLNGQSFTDKKGRKLVVQYEYDKSNDLHKIYVRPAPGEPVPQDTRDYKFHGRAGEIYWRKNPPYFQTDPGKTTVALVGVHPDYQRAGVATKLLALAREVSPNLEHSSNQSDEGHAWAQVAKYDPDQPRDPHTGEWTDAGGGSASAPAATPPKAALPFPSTRIPAAAKEFEAQHRADPVEHAMIVSAKGEPLWTGTDNSPNSVMLPDDHSDFVGGVTIHNHPAGTAPSAQDILILKKMGLGAIRVARKGDSDTHVTLTPAARKMDLKKFAAKVYLTESQVQSRIQSRIYERSLPVDMANKYHSDLVLNRLADAGLIKVEGLHDIPGPMQW